MSIVPAGIAQGQTKLLITVRSPIQATITTVIRDTGRTQLSTKARGAPLLNLSKRSPSPPQTPQLLRPSVKPPPVKSIRAFHSGTFRQLQVESKGFTNATDDKSEGEKRFSYRLSAAYCGKQFRFKPGSHYLAFDSTLSKQWLGGKSIEQSFWKDKRVPSGQDSCFISPIGTTGAAAFGVADGVGGWIDQGIDSADFAHGLCRHMTDICRGISGLSWSGQTPRDLLEHAYDEVCEDEKVTGGGSTVCVGIGDRRGNLEVAK